MCSMPNERCLLTAVRFVGPEAGSVFPHARTMRMVLLWQVLALRQLRYGKKEAPGLLLGL